MFDVFNPYSDDPNWERAIEASHKAHTSWGESLEAWGDFVQGMADIKQTQPSKVKDAND